MPERAAPPWAAWTTAARPWTVGIEEEVMLLEPETWAPANRIDELLAKLPEGRFAAETHACVAELQTSPHATVAGAGAGLASPRRPPPAPARGTPGPRGAPARPPPPSPPCP